MVDSRPHVAYVSYNGLTEPLGASQVLPYVRELSAKYRFTLVSFEKKDGPVARDAIDVESELRAHGNQWIRLRYHRAAGLLSKAWDIAYGAHVLRRLARRDAYRLVHARGYVPAAIAVRAGGGREVPYLFDIRGLQAEESVDAGTWPAGGLRYRLTKREERTLFARASGLVTLTQAVRPYLQEQPGLQGRDVPWDVIPCCVDLEHFRFDPAGRASVRASLGLSDHHLVFTYSGSVGTWYAIDAAIRLVREHAGGFLLFLTLAPTNVVDAMCARERLPRDRYAVRAVSRAEMPRYLSASDVTVCPVRPSLSKKASSPTKVAESLACGVPVVGFRGVGDLDELAASHPDSIKLIEHGQATTAVTLAPCGRSDSPRLLAESHFSLSIGVRRYDSLYSCLIR